ncbi:hypothetical protein C0993_002695 [Termitomyces sp. T159_Od127]|nr:hypothetical protein C0993_002695 [Termitomyces sp. T159_Od127]
MTAPTQPDTAIKLDMTVSEIELAQAKPEIDTPKASDPLRVTEMAVEVAIERSRATEALKARDATVQRLVVAHESIRQKSATIELLQRSLKSRVDTPLTSDSPTPTDRLEATKTKEEVARLERTIVELRVEIRKLKENAAQSVEVAHAL